MCKVCNNTGVVEIGGDVVEFGSAHVHLPSDVEFCDCVCDSGNCPRCNQPIEWNQEIDEFEDCEFCGWSIEQQRFVNDVEVEVSELPLSQREQNIVAYIETFRGVDFKEAGGQDLQPEAIAKALGFLVQEIDGDLNELVERNLIEVFSPSGQYCPTMYFPVER